MKIGILTHHYINNFGAFLQAYALQTALQEMYPNDEVQIIDSIEVEFDKRRSKSKKFLKRAIG